MVIPCLLLAEIYLIDTPHNSKWWATKCSGGVTVENINCWKRDVLKTIKYWLYVEPTRDYINWTRQVKKLAFNLFGQNNWQSNSNSPTIKVKPSSPINKPKLISLDTNNNNENKPKLILLSTNNSNENIKIDDTTNNPKINIEPASPIEKPKLFDIYNLLGKSNKSNTILNNNSNTILANTNRLSLLSNSISSNTSYKIVNLINSGTSFSVLNNNKSNINTNTNNDTNTIINSNTNNNINTNINSNTDTNTYMTYTSHTNRPKNESSNSYNGNLPMSISNIVNSSELNNYSNDQFTNNASSYTNASVPEKENSNSLYQSPAINENHESSITSSNSSEIGRRRTVKASRSNRLSSSTLNHNNASNCSSSLTSSIHERTRNSCKKRLAVDERSYSGDSDITRCNTQDKNNNNDNFDKSGRYSYMSDITRVPTTASESSGVYYEPNDSNILFSSSSITKVPQFKVLNLANIPAPIEELNIKGSSGDDITLSLPKNLGYIDELQSQQNQQTSTFSEPMLKKPSPHSVLYYPPLYQSSQNSNACQNNYEVPTPGRSNSDSSNAPSISSNDAISISHTNSMSSVVTTSTLDSSNSSSSPKYINGFNASYSYLNNNIGPYLPKNSFNPQCTQPTSVSGSYYSNKSNLAIPFANTRGKNVLVHSSTQNSQELYRSDSMEIEEIDERKFLSPPTTPY